jgi:predicted nucleotide-binding protein
MPARRKYIFVSYARPDLDTVRPIVDDLRREFRDRILGVDVWIDIEDLRPGQQWEMEIGRSLEESLGLLVFVSRASAKSEWTRREIEAAANLLGRLIIPVILEHVPELPVPLARRQWLDLSGRRSKSEIRRAVVEIADATEIYLRSEPTRGPVSAAEAPAVASSIAQEARGLRQEELQNAEPPDSVFVVHGHDDHAVRAVEFHLTKLGIKTVVLSRVAGAAQSLFQKFLEFSKEARFAIVILTADDLGSSRHQYNAQDVGEKALQFRARQNVILELGFFYGYLGWENVFVLSVPPDKVFPNFERPSDLDGVVFDVIDKTGGWRKTLRTKLSKAGFQFHQPKF